MKITAGIIGNQNNRICSDSPGHFFFFFATFNPHCYDCRAVVLETADKSANVEIITPPPPHTHTHLLHEHAKGLVHFQCTVLKID